METLVLTPEVLSTLSIAGPVGIVVVSILLIFGYLYKINLELTSKRQEREMELEAEKQKMEMENRSEFRNILKKQQENDQNNTENNAKLLELIEDIRKKNEEEKQKQEIRCENHRLTILKYATHAKESNKYVIECPNCKFRAIATEENIDNIIKQVED